MMLGSKSVPLRALPAMLALAPLPDTAASHTRVRPHAPAPVTHAAPSRETTTRLPVANSAAISSAVSARVHATAAKREGVLATAARYLGVRYRFGGTTPKAFDCSAFVRHVFRPYGIELPRTAREQVKAGRPVRGGLDSLRVGDLLFFRTRRGPAGHVAIYVGDGRIIHASAGSGRVRYDDLASRRGRWFVRHLSATRRVLEDPLHETIVHDGEGGADTRQ